MWAALVWIAGSTAGAPTAADLAAAIRAAATGAGCADRDGGITVRGRRPREDRFRLRREDGGFDPQGPVDSVRRERGRLIDGNGAAPDLTRGSCGATGGDGWTGCQVKAWREADQQRGR